ncbi:chemotaxis protein CheA [Thiorhodococcus mannitoliphagus]|uniref:Chemotaxis protein CheA n=1 Tax=Thiorhodococcus mannitoliphagus TaxID=329406 RepID=A0A6P1DYK1_9GAMM|nr:chemotaxis protein CheW [Thiorhodococcus mannitoliphagus]NEX20645.1 chemotaxis protein CheA [Thiorhodococcus mannitoliphagus]
MSIDLSQFYQVFFEEAAEHLAAMEGLLLELDVEAPDLETLNAIFRSAHSIKGGAATFGFNDMAEVTHVLETLLDRLRKQELDVTVEMVDTFLQAGDIIREQLGAHQAGTEYEDPRADEVCQRLAELAAPEIATSGDVDEVQQASTLWQVRFNPSEVGCTKAQALSALFDGLAGLGSIERVREDGPDLCHWQLLTDSDAAAIRDIMAFLCDADGVELLPQTDGEAPFEPGSCDADEDDSFGFFDGAPGTEQTATPSEVDEGDGFGFFAGAPGLDQAEAAAHLVDEDDGFGFFAGAPGADQAVDQEGDGFGLFGGSPGMQEVASVADRDRAEETQGFGFFDTAPGAPKQASTNAEPAAPSQPMRPVPSSAAKPSQAAAAKRPASGESSIRVSVEKVDELINLVGELVITHAMLAESASELDSTVFERIFDGLSNLERNSRDLQQAVMSIRMMPISFVFNRFPRVVRDTAATLGKKVSLKLIGEDTELDKGLIERLADPLNHLVRNSIDHGIELPEQRLEAGKPESGEIVLKASHRGGSVVVEITDDGGGLNREKILAKAEKQGIAMPENPSDKDVWHLIFHPGFSTAEKVTDISGRGVGMDVVRRNIEEMNGRVDIDSTPGQGTRITIRLPLTLAILDGLSVRMGEEMFILPLTAIQESIQPRPEQFKSVAGRGQVVQVSGEYLPLVVLQDVFNDGGEKIPYEDGILVIVDTNEGRAALLVEELVAQHQVVIKSLETNYRKVEGVSGATIMGDGRVALILDVDALVRLNRKAA